MASDQDPSPSIKWSQGCRMSIRATNGEVSQHFKSWCSWWIVHFRIYRQVFLTLLPSIPLLPSSQRCEWHGPWLQRRLRVQPIAVHHNRRLYLGFHLIYDILWVDTTDSVNNAACAKYELESNKQSNLVMLHPVQSPLPIHEPLLSCSRPSCRLP